MNTPPPTRRPKPPQPQPDRTKQAYTPTKSETTFDKIRAFTTALYPGRQWDQLGKAEQGRIRGAVANLPADATPQQIMHKTHQYAKDNPDLTITATAIAANWSAIGHQKGAHIAGLTKGDTITASLATTQPQQYTDNQGRTYTYALRLVDGQPAPIEGWSITPGTHRYRRIDTGQIIKPTGQTDPDGNLKFTYTDKHPDHQTHTTQTQPTTTPQPKDNRYGPPPPDIKQHISTLLAGQRHG